MKLRVAKQFLRCLQKYLLDFWSSVKKEICAATVPFIRLVPEGTKAINLPSSRQTRRPLPRCPAIFSQMRKRLGLSFRPGKGLIFPQEIASTTQRPDIVIHSKSKKIVVLIELTCPLEDRISTAHELKKDRYLELLSNCRCNGWTAFHFPVEVGSRGFVAYSLTSCLQKLGFSSYLAKKARNECSKIALRASYSIIFSGTSGNGLAANSFAFKSVAAVVSDIPLHWACPTRCTECWARIFYYVKEWFGSLFSSTLSTPFFFSKMPRLELTFSESKFAACQSGTLSRVSRAFRIPDIDSRAKCVRSIKLSLIPNPSTPRKACLKRRLKCCCRSLKAWLTSHFWWILPHFTCLVNLVRDYILDGSAGKKIDLCKLLTT